MFSFHVQEKRKYGNQGENVLTNLLRKVDDYFEMCCLVCMTAKMYVRLENTVALLAMRWFPFILTTLMTARVGMVVEHYCSVTRNIADLTELFVIAHPLLMLYTLSIYHSKLEPLSPFLISHERKGHKQMDEQAAVLCDK